MKTVLVLDKMPEKCVKCPCVSYNSQANRWECNAELLCRDKATVKVVDIYKKPEWCRLKPLPQKGFGDADDIEQISYYNGWNDCIDKIAEENEHDKQMMLLYNAISQLERDKQDCRKHMDMSTDRNVVEYYKGIVDGCILAQKVLMEWLNAHS
jgi:hypothetical protein